MCAAVRALIIHCFARLCVLCSIGAAISTSSMTVRGARPSRTGFQWRFLHTRVNATVCAHRALLRPTVRC